jgi:hypothetical protein
VLAQEAQQGQEGQAKDRSVIAVNRIEQMHSGPFQPVGSDRCSNGWACARQIPGQEGIGELPHCQAGPGDVVPQAFFAHLANDCRDQDVGPSTQRPQVVPCFLHGGWFIEPAIFTDKQLVAADDQGVLCRAGDALGFHFSQQHRHVVSPKAFCTRASLDLGLVNVRGTGLESQTSGG